MFESIYLHICICHLIILIRLNEAHDYTEFYFYQIQYTIIIQPCSFNWIKSSVESIIFLVAVNMTLHVRISFFQVVCTVIAAFLQYFFLVEFFLMLAMGVYYFLQITVLYYSFSTANDIKARLNMKRLLPIAWGTND